jgi:hypothetical protein
LGGGRAGSAHGDLCELEQTTYWHVMDWQTMTVVRTLTGGMSARLAGGLWADHAFGGVQDVTVSPSGQIQVHDETGRVETLIRPGP